MSDVIESPERIRAGANRLYWQSGDTVDELAARLGMSRHALYSSIRPAPAGVECTECGAPMAYANRSARGSGRARCPDCGATRVVRPEHRAASQPDEDSPVAFDAESEARPSYVEEPGWRRALAGVPRDRVATLGGLALLGAAFGVAAVMAFRRT